MALTPGIQLGRYEILEKLGAGGMGEVYVARDPRLERPVALKVLPAEMGRDPERRARFEREARLVAGLNHPHICRVYDVGQHDGAPYLVLELLEGKTLAGRLFAGALPLSEALEAGIQVADALDHAHGKGIVHRDVKPENVVLTQTGAKLLDFGIATLREDGEGTATSLTHEGQVLGTPHTMAPEQLLGKPVDARADVFALGCLLFEMLAGRRAFSTTSLHEPTPSLREAAPGVPPALERLITACLAVDPDERWSSARDVRLQLQGILEDHELAGLPGPEPAAMRPRRASRIPWLLAVVATLAAGALAWLHFFRPAPLLRPRGTEAATAGVLSVLSVQPPLGTSLVHGEAPQVSPDGRALAFVAADETGKSLLYVRPLDALAARALPETEGALLPFWSPDGRQLGFFAGGQLKTVPVAGGTPHALAPAPVPRGGAWSEEGWILYSGHPNQPPSVIPASGGEPRAAPTQGPLRGFRWFPSFLPGGRRYVYVGLASFEERRLVVRVGSLDGPETTDLLPEAQGSVLYVAPGFLLQRRGSTLVAQRFDPATLALAGDPVTVAEGVGGNPVTLQGLFSASETGVLAYAGTAPISRLAWFDREGKRLEEATSPGGYNSLCLTPDEAAVYDLADPGSGNVDLWRQARNEANPSRLTFHAAVDFYPICAASGKEVVFASLRGGPPAPHRVSLAAPGEETALRQWGDRPVIPTDLTRDGGSLIVSVLDPATGWDVAVLAGTGEGDLVPFAASPADERQGRLSPDGRLLAYVSNETGTFEVYVKLFPGSGPSSGARWQVSRGGGLQPQWRGDSGELYYVAADRTLTGVEIKSARERGRDGPDFATGIALPLVRARITGWERESQGAQYAVSADGARFLVNTATEATIPVTLMQNWTDVLARSP